jgi:hypothetical protein
MSLSPGTIARRIRFSSEAKSGEIGTVVSTTLGVDNRAPAGVTEL